MIHKPRPITYFMRFTSRPIFISDAVQVGAIKVARSRSGMIG
jgi:hypothetical protein